MIGPVISANKTRWRTCSTTHCKKAASIFIWLQTGMLCSKMNHNAYCPPFGYQASVMQRSHEGPYSEWSYFQRRRVDMPRLLKETWPTAVWLLPCRAAQWLVLGQQSVTFAVFKFSLKTQTQCRNAEQMAVWEGLYAVVSVSGEGCCPNPSHWSNGWSESYPPSMWIQASPSNTHGPAQWATFIQQCFSGHLFLLERCFLLQRIHICFQYALLSFH